MKIKNLIFFLMTGILLSGLVAAGFISVNDKEVISEQNNQNQIQVPENSNAASDSKGIVLLLLAVGVIGVLGISRKKRGLGNSAQRNEINTIPDNQNLNEDKQKPKAKNP